MTEEPLSDEALRRVRGKPSREVEQCPVCSMLKYGALRFEKGDEVIANSLSDRRSAVAQLREKLRLGENVATVWIDACSVCGRLYRSEKSHEYLVNGASEETESHDPVTVDEVLAMSELGWSRLPGALLRELGDGAWAVIGEPARQWPIRRAR